MKTLIRVTSEHLTRAQEQLFDAKTSLSQSCPVAMAVCDALNISWKGNSTDEKPGEREGTTRVWAASYSIGVGGMIFPGDMSDEDSPLSDRPWSEFVRTFDSLQAAKAEAMLPLEFEIDVPEAEVRRVQRAVGLAT